MRRVAEQAGDRNGGADSLPARARRHAGHHGSAGAEIPHHATDRFIWDDDLNPHQRLQEYRTGLGERFVQRRGRRDAEGLFAAVHLAQLVRHHLYPDIPHRRSGERSRHERLAEAVLHRLRETIGQARGDQDLLVAGLDGQLDNGKLPPAADHPIDSTNPRP